MSDEGKQHHQRYMAAMHAMQTGVRMMLELAGSQEATPKHLRVGVNSALCDSSSLAQLLMAKGIITEVEYLKAIADGAEEEVARYKAALERHFPGKTFELH